MSANRCFKNLLAGALLCLSCFPAQALQTVPERMLRAWDPVTFVFDADVADDPTAPVFDEGEVFERWFKQPGEYVWIDSRTLQFRPAEPWPAYVSATYVRAGERVELHTLLEPPTSTQPAAGSEGLRHFDTVVLFLPTPVDAAILRRQLTLVVAPLDPLSGAGKRTLPDGAFDVKVSDDPKARFGVRVTMTLKRALQDSEELSVHLRLGRNADAPVWTGLYRTAGRLRLGALGCASRRVPVAGSGTDYQPDAAVQCSPERASLVAEFTAGLTDVSALAMRAAVHVAPDPGPLTFERSKNLLHIGADFVPGQTYRLQVDTGTLLDPGSGQVHSTASSSVYVRFASVPPTLRWRTQHGVVERYGAQHVPVLAQAVTHADLRVHRVLPLDRRYWPFPQTPVITDDLARPAGPGERPDSAWDSPAGPGAARLAQHLRLLADPVFSDLTPLATASSGALARGLDLRRVLTQADGQTVPGTYLVGMRDAAGSAQRRWMRIQVTDLALSTASDSDSVRFVVTSLRSGTPVRDARVTVEGSLANGQWATFIDGRTNVLGAYEWRLREIEHESGGSVQRIVVRYEDDTLVLDAAAARDSFQNNHWSQSGYPWLQWTRDPPPGRRAQQSLHCHLFTERPVYKPAEPVHIKGWARIRERGDYASTAGKATVNIVGPGDRRWRIPVEFNDSGTFYHRFDEPDLPTGSYWVGLEYDGWNTCGGFEFAKRDYVLPELEVSLHGADKVPLDAPFELTATGRFYAGGRVAGQPIRWRVTQFPHTFEAAALHGFKFASTRVFSQARRLASEAVVDRTAQLDTAGSARVRIDPSAEPSARPRRYVVEATVTGTDGRTVTATRQVLGLPAVLPGIKVAQVVRRIGSVAAQFVVLGADGKPREGVPIELRLLRREWHAQLRSGDHTGGVARYLTEPVDTEIERRTMDSALDPQAVPFSITRPGVYLLEASTRDRLGRLTSVTADFFVAADALLANQQSWAKAPGRTFKVTPDKARYVPTETAQLVLQSPFASGRALMVIEDPRGNRYRWVDVSQGQAVVNVDLAEHFAPRLPVHFLLLRGRSSQALAGAGLDLGRPATAAATASLQVTPTGQVLTVALEHPPTARPGQSVPVTIRLRDAADQPVAGEVSLWLVDQAVLALGRERRLNPLPDFVRPGAVRTRIYDTRNNLFGLLPHVVNPGGGAGDSEALDLLDNVTPRKDFVAVPYYEPSLQVPQSGELTVNVRLPDNLTVFKLRAKAITRMHRFGHAVGSLGVRIPVVVQPALPAFVRPGDRFTAGAVIRAIDGKSGPGRVQVAVQGLDLLGADTQALAIGRAPTRAEFGFEVPGYTLPAGGVKSGLAAPQVEVTVAAERLPVQTNADGDDDHGDDGEPARDAFTMTLPLVHTPETEFRRQQVHLAPGESAQFAPVALSAASGRPTQHVVRRVMASPDANVLHMAGAADFLVAYPYGCTEQRIAKASGGLALKQMADTLGWQGAGLQRLLDGVGETLAWIAKTRDANGLVAYWPGSQGVVALTAWSLQFAVSAREAGHALPEGLELELVRTLRRALRSDFPLFIESSQYAERVWALVALGDAGLPDAGYAAELARRAEFLPAESLAQVLRVLVQSGSGAQAEIERLRGRLWSLLRTRSQGGSPTYLGLEEQGSASALILPGETRAIAELLRTAVVLNEGEARQLLLSTALAGLAGPGGWGSTNANAAAMRALGAHWQGVPTRFGLLIKSAAEQGQLQSDGALLTHTVAAHAPLEVRAARDGPQVNVALETRIEHHGVAANRARAAQGFVVRRAWYRVPENGAPLQALQPDVADGERTLVLQPGEIIEEHIEVVNFVDRYHVALTAPRAAGLEALDAALATAPAEARPSAPDSTRATYIDRRVAKASWYFNFLPKGNHVVRTRLRAVTRGRFVLPPARAEAMYNAAQFGRSDGHWIGIGNAG